MTNPVKQKKVDVEMLLRLKRTEVPPPEFWARFDRELRVRQLAAIVRRDPWWQRLGATLSDQGRYLLPAGAAATLIVTVFVARDHHWAGEARLPVAAAAALTPAAASVPGIGEVAPSGGASSQPLTEEIAASTVASLLAPEESAARPRPAESGYPAAGVQMPGQVSAPEARSGLASSMLVSLPASGGVLDGTAKSLAPASVTDPMLQMQTPADRRRTRLLASSLPSGSSGPALANDRVASRLSDDRLTEEAIRRFGARGDRVLVKF